MSEPIDLNANALVAISRDSLNALRASLFRDLGGTAATYLQDAGYRGAGPVYEAFEAWTRRHGGPAPADLPLDDFAKAVSDFFAECGWGRLGFALTEQGVASVESTDWAEAAAADGSQMSGCYFSSGVLADFFGRVSDAQVAVMETECRSMGSSKCRFLIGTPEKLQVIYDQLAAG